ncbi:hypothetical protein SAMN05216466_107105 [Paraburkholderia phenazinium]|uniref:Uncharacterized protein n=1 Tax=Paraburkholderia phenazinium TaxID=60549 RepID=A0A1G7ZNG7_9BURK|nr:hypothetical protein [Paraburkholderia phenazinium]SDH10253.1 hypothetical protein SAMN05216466_107105 [Paraburkholderia phenazinium]
MTLDLDQIERINTAGDRYGHITPGVVVELIAEVRRLRAELNSFVTACGEMNQEVCELREDAERYRWAISLEDNVEQLYAAVVSCGPDMPGSINIEIDAHRAKEPK